MCRYNVSLRNYSNSLTFDWQRRQWLSEAIDSLQGSDPVKSMLQDVQVVLITDDGDDESIVKKVGALENLQLHTEDADLANGFLFVITQWLITQLWCKAEILFIFMYYYWQYWEVEG